jgi:hypothetical protein
LYQRNEIEISQKYLGNVFKQLEGEICILGGWATYFIVNEDFEKSTGMKYLGTRDIDVGFHIDMNWTAKQLESSVFANAIKSMEAIGFRNVSFRWFKDFDAETKKELTPEESKRIPAYQIIKLYVDPIVDNIHPLIKQTLGFHPIDEPLLSLVFKDKIYTFTKFFGTSIMLPKPHVLLAMKLNSVTHRDKEFKKIKDIADIYALLWFSDVDIGELKTNLFTIYLKEKARKTVLEFNEKEIEKVSSLLEVSAGSLRTVFSELTK